jgi:hypothetical protein
MSDEELIKQACKDWALSFEEKTGKFPTTTNWVVGHPDNPAPINKAKVAKLFGSYNNFKEFCGKPVSVEQKKQACKDWAFAYEEKTRKFPVYDNWKIRLHKDNPPPFSGDTVSALFGSYNNFRESCGKRPLSIRFPTLKEAFENQLTNKIVTETLFRGSGCWHSSSLAPNTTGYIQLKWNPSPNNSKKFTIHILSYLYHKDGDVTLESYENRDLELKVRHMCAKNAGENKKCFNPDHLELGTNADNSNDAKSYHAGYKAYDKVYNILTEHNENITAEIIKQHSIEALAVKYGVSISSIRDIVNDKTWKDHPGREQYEAEKNA